jgi:hypothetical protein
MKRLYALLKAHEELEHISLQEKAVDSLELVSSEVDRENFEISAKLPGMNRALLILDPNHTHFDAELLENIRLSDPDPAISDIERYRRYLASLLQPPLKEKISQSRARISEVKNKVTAKIRALSEATP